MNKMKRTNDPDANPDAITGAPGSHPVGTGVGAAAGGAAAIAAGAAIGSAVGPVGTAVGAAVGAVAGGLIGKGVAEGINPTAEHAYWRDTYASRPYVAEGKPYEEYAPAYQYGWESTVKYTNQEFDDVENELAEGWNRVKGRSSLDWENAREATREAWARACACQKKRNGKGA